MNRRRSPIEGPVSVASAAWRHRPAHPADPRLPRGRGTSWPKISANLSGSLQSACRNVSYPATAAHGLLKFLIDNTLSRQAAAELGGAGHDAVHVRDRGLQAADDDVIFVLAAAEDRIVISADSGFGTLLALRQAANPSFILSRRGVERRPERQAALLLASLTVIADVLVRGAAARAGL
jgi:predicted nuclease of predicted toxin-antitoxin system